MSKKYLLEEAKELVKNGTHQVHNDCKEKYDILCKINDAERMNANYKYYWDCNCSDTPNLSKEIIPLSAIEDIRWGDEVQCSENELTWSSQKWFFCGVNPKKEGYIVTSEKGGSYEFKIIRKPVPNFSALIQSTQEEADKIQKGYVVKIEKL